MTVVRRMSIYPICTNSQGRKRRKLGRLASMATLLNSGIYLVCSDARRTSSHPDNTRGTVLTGRKSWIYLGTTERGILAGEQRPLRLRHRRSRHDIDN
jgi:hypothetical protein